MDVMLARGSSHMVLSLEDSLANRGGADVAERFLRLADQELDRAYRLAGPIRSMCAMGYGYVSLQPLDALLHSCCR
jgi:hypothetical protein